MNDPALSQGNLVIHFNDADTFLAALPIATARNVLQAMDKQWPVRSTTNTLCKLILDTIQADYEPMAYNQAVGTYTWSPDHPVKVVEVGSEEEDDGSVGGDDGDGDDDDGDDANSEGTEVEVADEVDSDTDGVDGMEVSSESDVEEPDLDGSEVASMDTTDDVGSEVSDSDSSSSDTDDDVAASRFRPRQSRHKSSSSKARKLKKKSKSRRRQHSSDDGSSDGDHPSHRRASVKDIGQFEGAAGSKGRMQKVHPGTEDSSYFSAVNQLVSDFHSAYRGDAPGPFATAASMSQAFGCLHNLLSYVSKKVPLRKRYQQNTLALWDCLALAEVVRSMTTQAVCKFVAENLGLTASSSAADDARASILRIARADSNSQVNLSRLPQPVVPKSSSSSQGAGRRSHPHPSDRSQSRNRFSPCGHCGYKQPASDHTADTCKGYCHDPTCMRPRCVNERKPGGKLNRGK
ncbi:hypothetical protein HDU76_007202 [Blyttiomyces sp. JEL0837]|nr:hypothetical protein HDU76_007202 [Blyttiomyces sp. JEL0837]